MLQTTPAMMVDMDALSAMMAFHASLNLDAHHVLVPVFLPDTACPDEWNIGFQRDLLAKRVADYEALLGAWAWMRGHVRNLLAAAEVAKEHMDRARAQAAADIARCAENKRLIKLALLALSPDGHLDDLHGIVREMAKLTVETDAMDVEVPRTVQPGYDAGDFVTLKQAITWLGLVDRHLLPEMRAGITRLVEYAQTFIGKNYEASGDVPRMPEEREVKGDLGAVSLSDAGLPVLPPRVQAALDKLLADEGKRATVFPAAWQHLGAPVPMLATSAHPLGGSPMRGLLQTFANAPSPIGAMDLEDD